MPSSLDIIISRFRKDMQELGFEAAEFRFNQMKKYALDYCRQIRTGKNPDERSRMIYALYHQMILLEEDIDFLENRYPDY